MKTLKNTTHLFKLLILTSFTLTLFSCDEEQAFRVVPDVAKSNIAVLILQDGNMIDFGTVKTDQIKSKEVFIKNIGLYKAEIKNHRQLLEHLNFKFVGNSWPGVNGTCGQDMIIEQNETCSIVIEFNPAEEGLQELESQLNYYNGFTDSSLDLSLKGIGDLQANITSPCFNGISTNYPECNNCVDTQGNEFANDQMETRIRFINNEVAYNGTCEEINQQRTCSNGVISDWSNALYSDILSCSQAQARNCTYNEQIINHNDSVSFTLFNSESVDYGLQCQSEARTRLCIDGTLNPLSGNSDFSHETCAVNDPLSCTLSDSTIAHGSSYTQEFYGSETVNFGQLCQSIELERLCSNGVLSDFDFTSGYSFDDCSVNPPLNCEVNGTIITHEQYDSQTFFNTLVATNEETCQSLDLERQCFNGVLDPFELDPNYPYLTCTVGQAVTDSFTFKNSQEIPKLDILWVIDNSGSMAGEQTNLKNNMGAFIDNLLTEEAIDIRMMIATTDVYLSSDVISRGIISSVYDIRKDTLNSIETYEIGGVTITKEAFAESFKNTVEVGTSGDYREKGIKTSYTGLSEGGFFNTQIRSGSKVTTIILSDEDETDSKGLTELSAVVLSDIEAIQTIYPSFKVFSIVDTSPTASVSSKGTQYMLASEKTFGNSYSIHDSNFSSHLQNISDQLLILVDQFSLTQRPIESSIAVTTATNDVLNFEYNSETNTIKIIAPLPADNTEIFINYVNDPN